MIAFLLFGAVGWVAWRIWRKHRAPKRVIVMYVTLSVAMTLLVLLGVSGSMVLVGFLVCGVVVAAQKAWWDYLAGRRQAQR